jgi:hypothetical protein
MQVGQIFHNAHARFFPVFRKIIDRTELPEKLGRICYFSNVVSPHTATDLNRLTKCLENQGNR